MPAQENSVQPTTVVPRPSAAAHHRQQHAGGDAADPHHAEDHAVHAGPKAECSRTSSGSSAQGAAAGTE